MKLDSLTSPNILLDSRSDGGVQFRTHLIGIVVPGSDDILFNDHSYFPLLLQGIIHAANQCDASLLLWLRQLNEDHERFSQRILRSGLCDGLVIVSSLDKDDPLMSRLVDVAPHFVMVERPQNYEHRISYITVDNVLGGQMATEHLINLGYQRIAHITGPLNVADAQERLTGYQNALRQAGIAYDHELVESGGFSHEAGYQAMQKLLPQKPDAVFVMCDLAAVGAMHAIHDAGLRVPDDIAVIGFDDLDIAGSATPTLTTIRQPVRQKGAAALHLLLDLINGKTKSPYQVIFPTQLVIRQSCGANRS